jgi:hypothetical protein
MLRTFIVTSRDGIQFSVQTTARTERQAQQAEIAEARYAASKFADELDVPGSDFHRERSMDDLLHTEYVRPEVVAAARRLPKLTLLQGGLSDIFSVEDIRGA